MPALPSLPSAFCHVVLSSVEVDSAASKVPVGTKFLAVADQGCSGKTKDDVMAMIKAAKSAGPTFTITFDVPDKDVAAKKEEEQAAAAKIQARARGKKVRQELAAKKEEEQVKSDDAPAAVESTAAPPKEAEVTVKSDDPAPWKKLALWAKVAFALKGNDAPPAVEAAVAPAAAPAAAPSSEADIEVVVNQ